MQNDGLVKTVLAMSAVSFFLAFNYFVLGALKETLLVTAPEAGAEVIPFVKMWLLISYFCAFPCHIYLVGDQEVVPRGGLCDDTLFSWHLWGIYLSLLPLQGVVASSWPCG